MDPLTLILTGVAIKRINDGLNNNETAAKIDAEAVEMVIKSEIEAERQRETTQEVMSALCARKKAIIKHSLNPFMALYQKILSIKFSDGAPAVAESDLVFNGEELTQTVQMVEIADSKLTSSETVGAFLMGGLPGAMGGVPFLGGISNVIKRESELTLDDAVRRQSQAKVVERQRNIIITGFKEIQGQCQDILDLLGKLNFYFLQQIHASDRLIAEKKYDGVAYTDADKDLLRICCETAHAVKVIVCAPVLNQQGELLEAASAAVEFGNAYIQKIEHLHIQKV